MKNTCDKSTQCQNMLLTYDDIVTEQCNIVQWALNDEIPLSDAKAQILAQEIRLSRAREQILRLQKTYNLHVHDDLTMTNLQVLLRREVEIKQQRDYMIGAFSVGNKKKEQKKKTKTEKGEHYPFFVFDKCGKKRQFNAT